MDASQFIGKTIQGISLNAEANGGNGALIVTFINSSLWLYDAGQDCCEERYLTCDDDLPYYVGSKLLSIEEREGPTTHEYGDPHETAFLIVTTDKGAFTICTHNENNGYYGGFSLVAKDVRP